MITRKLSGLEIYHLTCKFLLEFNFRMKTLTVVFQVNGMFLHFYFHCDFSEIYPPKNFKFGIEITSKM